MYQCMGEHARAVALISKALAAGLGPAPIECLFLRGACPRPGLCLLAFQYSAQMLGMRAVVPFLARRSPFCFEMSSAFTRAGPARRQGIK